MPADDADRMGGEPGSFTPEQLDELRRTIPGADSHTPLAMPWPAWRAILKRVWTMLGFHNVSLLAAGVAFYAFLALVPLLASVVLVYGLLGNPDTVADTVYRLAAIAPPDVLSILRNQMLAIVTTSKSVQGFALVLAILLALFGAMRAATAMMGALNIIYEEHETRGYIATTLVAAGITASLVGVAIVGTLAISLFSYTANVLAAWLGDGLAVVIQLLTWLLAGALASVVFGIVFRFAPDRRAAKWRWLSIGSILATLLWLLITIGFGFYVANFDDYNATYGSLSAVVVLLMWLFLSAYAILCGAELNSEIERQTMVDSTVGPPKPIGSRGAVMADSVVVNPVSRTSLESRRRQDAQRLAEDTA